MSTKAIMYVSVAAGAAGGALATYPYELGTWVCLIAWGLIGMILGRLSEERLTLIYSGALYGVVLTIVFLYSRFGGNLSKIWEYTFLMAAMSVIGCVAGIINVLVGSEFKKRFRPKHWLFLLFRYLHNKYPNTIK